MVADIQSDAPSRTGVNQLSDYRLRVGDVSLTACCTWPPGRYFRLRANTMTNGYGPAADKLEKAHVGPTPSLLLTNHP